MTKLLCCSCRKPDDNLMLLISKPGFGERSRPCCSTCFVATYATGNNGQVVRQAAWLRVRFTQAEMPSPIPSELYELWAA